MGDCVLPLMLCAAVDATRRCHSGHNTLASSVAITADHRQQFVWQNQLNQAAKHIDGPLVRLFVHEAVLLLLQQGRSAG